MNYERILETYSLEEILEYNDLTEAEALEVLDDLIELRLPPIPVDARWSILPISLLDA